MNNLLTIDEFREKLKVIARETMEENHPNPTPADFEKMERLLLAEFIGPGSAN